MHKCLGALLILILGLFGSSCSVERSIARKFVNDRKPGAVLLIAPDYIYKDSYKVPEIKDFDKLSDWEKDSLAFEESTVIKFCNDSMFSAAFLNALDTGLMAFGFDVYHTPELFLSGKKDTSYILNFAQIQLEEFYESLSDDVVYDDTTKADLNFWVTAININNWLEISRLNNGDKPQLLFSNYTIYDDVVGDFKFFPFLGEYLYDYKVDSLNVEKLYSAAKSLGYEFSYWLYDYMLNDYVSRNMPEGRVPKHKFIFDTEFRWLRKQTYDPFILMDQEEAVQE